MAAHPAGTMDILSGCTDKRVIGTIDPVLFCQLLPHFPGQGETLPIYRFLLFAYTDPERTA